MDEFTAMCYGMRGAQSIRSWRCQIESRMVEGWMAVGSRQARETGGVSTSERSE